ncbi:hypothetical protein ACTA71_006970 [Dictyostelium dimigraforme]
MVLIYSPERFQIGEVELRDLNRESEEFKFKIQVVYNKQVWNNYLDHYSISSKSHGEVFVFHGTSLNDPSLICNEGLRVEKTKSGLYFAANASTSNGFTHRVGPVYQIFMCRVFVPSSQLKDSLHVIKNNNCHYPQYLISYLSRYG